MENGLFLFVVLVIIKKIILSRLFLDFRDVFFYDYILLVFVTIINNE